MQWNIDATVYREETEIRNDKVNIATFYPII
jgi:hypothetical protein